MDATLEQLLAHLEQNPLDVAALDELRAACEHAGDYGPLAQCLEAQARVLAENEGDPHELGRLHCELGNLWRDRLGRADRAIVHYRAAIDFDAAQRPAMQAARALFAQAGKWDQVAKLLGREAESMPRGPKKAALLAELAKVFRDRLSNIENAAGALREAIEADQEDLQVQHDLATLLLDAADQDLDAFRAEQRRREAAEILCKMATGVGDDYAFAYVEAALDAVPDHGTAITMLERLAPRVGRADTIPPRWVAGLQMAPTGPLSRDLRLKLARAYAEVGQLDDARVCLQPLTDDRDPEALKVLGNLGTTKATPSKAPLPSTTTEVPLDEEEEVEALELEPEHEERTTADADELAAMAARDAAESQEDGAEPLADLAGIPDAGTARAELPSSVSAELAELEDEDLAATPVSEDRDIHAELTQPRIEAQAIEESTDEEPDSRTPQVGVPTEILRASERPAAKKDSDITAEHAAKASEPAPNVATEAKVEAKEPGADITKLRAELERKLRYRDLRGAADIAERILSDAPTDAQAITAIEDYCRATRDFKRMRSLALRVAREPAFPVDARIARLREAAMLSESKLGDVEGTIAAYRELYALSPMDEEARTKLYKLLTRNQRWDELAQMIEREAMSAASASDRARKFRELGALHRDKRDNVEDAIEAFSNARELEPDQASDAEALSELLLRAERFAEATTYLEARLVHAEGPQKAQLLRTLSEIYEAKLGDVERAYEINEQLLALDASDSGALDRRERIDERLGRYDLVLSTLQMRLSNAHTAEERVALLLRIAELCNDKLADREEELRSLKEALSLTPGDAQVFERAERAFDEAERGAEFTEALAEMRNASTDKTLRTSLLRRIAARLAKEDDLDAAIAAHQELLRETDDVDARRTLVGLLEQAPDRANELIHEVDLLANQVGREEAKVLRISRAEILRDTLKDVRAAADELERIVNELAPDDLALLERLALFAEESLDLSRAASAKKKQLALIKDAEKRAALAEELSGLYEDELEDEDGTVFALHAWAEAASSDPRPHLRLLPLLEARGDHAALVKALDALATLAVAEDEVSDYALRAARISSEQLQDHDSAWRRLVPRVVDAGDQSAEEALREVARVSGRGRELAELYVGLAQRTEDGAAQVRRWMDAAHAYEQLGDAADKALEAALRALAKDMDSPTLLEEVDRLAAAAGAWARLGQVYDALARRAETPDTKIRVLLRQARLLEEKAQDPGAAFARLSIATQIDPAHEDAYREAIRLAALAGQHEDALLIHERRAAAAIDASQKLDALLAACTTCKRALSDMPRAMGYLARAVTLAGADKAVLMRIEEAAETCDEQDEPLDGRGLTFALAEVLKQRAEEAKRDAALSAVWLSRAAVLIEQSLSDVRGAFDVLERAASLAPANEIVLDSLEQVAERAGTLDSLVTHYQRAADDAIDGNTASISLRRLGLLLEGKLGKPEQAADVYKQLVMLRPRDLEASDKLRSCLKQAGRFKDLLSAIDRQLSLVNDDAQKLALLRDAAEAWETGLNNRFEALDAWRKISALAPEDETAKEAIARLEKKPTIDESSLLESDVVVLPEDLAPSVPAPREEAIAAAETLTTDGPSAEAEEPAHEDTPADGVAAGAHETSGEPTTEHEVPHSEPQDEAAEAEHAARALEGDDANGGVTDPAPAPVMTLPPDLEHDATLAHGAEAVAVISGEASLSPHADLFGKHESDGAELPADERTHVGVDVAQMLSHDEPAAETASEQDHGADAEPEAVADEELSAADDGDVHNLEEHEADELEEHEADEFEEHEADEFEEADAHAEALDDNSEDERATPAPSIVREPVRPDLLAELSSLDAREAEGHDIESLESGALELDSSQVSLDEPTGPTDTLDALSSMLERGPLRTNPPARAQRIPPPPPRRVEAPARPSVPPPPPPRASLPSEEPPPAGSRPPPPPRRS